jgi:hypothetical protein
VRAAVQAGAAITRVVGVGRASPADVDLWTGYGLGRCSVLLSSAMVRVYRLSRAGQREGEQQR